MISCSATLLIDLKAELIVSDPSSYSDTPSPDSDLFLGSPCSEDPFMGMTIRGKIFPYYIVLVVFSSCFAYILLVFTHVVLKCRSRYYGR